MFAQKLSTFPFPSVSTVTPCGACRQVISEFCGGDMPVYYPGANGEIMTATVSELLPRDSLEGLKNRGNAGDS